MSKSLYELATKSKYNKDYIVELHNRIQNNIQTGLLGFNDEHIVYNLSSDIINYTNYINNNINLVTKSDIKEVIILDSLYSATIEGARTTVENVKKAINNKNKTKSDIMVLNTIAASNYAIQNGIDKNNIGIIWDKLVDTVCENENVRGNPYRTGQVYVSSTNKIIHTPCNFSQIPKFMNYLFSYKNNNKLLDVCIKHFYLVYIHPFCDGNGRMARTWVYSDLIRSYNDRLKYISISNEIAYNINDYYKTLKESEFVYDNLIDITTFIEYILSCICNAVQKGRTNSIILTDTDKYIINKISINGITMKKLVNNSYSESTLRKSINKLIDNDIVYKIKEGNHLRYFKYKV